MCVLALDIGGTGIKAAVIDRNGHILSFSETATEAYRGKDHILRQMFSLVEQIRRGFTLQAIGIGSAGRVNVSEGTIVFATSNLPGWQGLKLRKLVEDRMGLPVIVDNDANAAALGEAWMGAARHADSSVLLSLGTGVGGGIIDHGQVLRGSHWSAGELGHVVLYPGGLPCNCGQFGCVEQYISGHALVLRANAQGNKHYESGKEVFADFQQGDAWAKQIVVSFIHDVAISLRNIQHVYDPLIIVIGGGVSNSFRSWGNLLQPELVDLPMPVNIAMSELGNKAGCAGAAKLAWDLVDQS